MKPIVSNNQKIFSMKENENNVPLPEKEKEKDKKELTPQQLQQRKKMIVFPLLFLLFAGCLWLIFAPSGDNRQEQGEGFNTDLPTPKQSGIVSDKKDAYMQEAMQAKEQDKMRSLQDFAFALGEEQRAGANGGQMADLPDDEVNINPKRADAFQASNRHYHDINRQLGSFYEQPATEVDEQAQLALEWRIQELERKMEEEEIRKNATEEQLALIERSYQLANRYTGTQDDKVKPAVETSVKEKVKPQPVSMARKNVVSLLSAPVDDDEFMEEYGKPRNIAFNTAAGNEQMVNKNSIAASVNHTVTVTDGQEIQLRLLEPMRAGKHMIPQNTVISGTARIGGERMNIAINYIQHGGNVVPVEIVVFDLDGNPGICVPGSEEVTAAKEIAANMGTSMGSSITITDDAGSQLLSDLGRSAIQGVSQYVSRKMRTVKVTLKAGHRVMLLPPM